MFTEAELREALRHSAARADTLPAGDLASASPSRADTPVLAPRRATRGRFLVPVAAAAVVVAAVTAAVVVTRTGDEAGHQIGNQTTAPPTASSTTAEVTTEQAARRPGRPVDLATASVPDAWYTYGDAENPEHAAQTIERHLPDGPTLTIDVVPAAAIDPGRVPRDREVSIAGTTGWYGKLKLYPIDANTGPFSDKWLPQWTVSFQSPGGDWVFVTMDGGFNERDPQNPPMGDPDVLVAEYERTGVTFEAGAGRVPLRVGYLPPDLRFGNAITHATHGAGGGFYFPSDLGGEGRRVNVMINRAPPPSAPTTTTMQVPAQDLRCGGAECPEVVKWQVGTHVIELSVTGYDAAEVQRIRDSIEPAPDVTDVSTWFPLADAYGGG